MPGSFSAEVVEFFRTGTVATSVVAICLFRLLFGLSLLLKQLVERRRQYPAHVGKGTFVYETYIRPRRLRRLAHRLYVYSFRLRPILLVLFIVGLPRLAAALLLISYVGEIYVLFRYHVVLATIAMGIVFVDPEFSAGWSSFLDAIDSPIRVNAPGVLFLKTVVLTMYLASAWRKIQYGFYDGVVLSEGARFSLDARGRRFPDHPHRSTQYLLRAVVSRFPVATARMTIGAEIILFVLLFAGGPFAYAGVIFGVVLHLGLALLFPITLSFFTAMMISTYVFWLIE